MALFAFALHYDRGRLFWLLGRMDSRFRGNDDLFCDCRRAVV